MIRTKTKFKLLIWTFLILPFLVSAQQTRVVTLSVDTENISSQNIATTSNFGQTDGSTNEDYTVLVQVGDTIVWQGLSSSNATNHIVNVTQINHVGGARLFDRNVLNGDGGTPERVIGIISEGRSGDEKKYNIKFRLSNKPGTFIIDPKIKVE